MLHRGACWGRLRSLELPEGRLLDLYEHQGKELFARFGIPVSDGRVATTADEARAAASELGGQVVVKAQVLTGGRGKAGGVKLATDKDDAWQKARDILGLDIKGHVVRRLWIESASDIATEYYFSITFDRGAKKPLFMLTTQGGIDIEQVAAETPEALARLHLDPLQDFHPWVANRLVWDAGIPVEQQKQVKQIITQAYRCFRECDAMLVEINPLIVTPDGTVKALDAKVTIDDNALYKHPDIAAMRDVAAADPQEQMARERGVTYVKLDGEVGILGNGAGLVMSTLDVVAQVGGHAGELPRRRRRGAGRRDRAGARGDPVRRQGALDPVQHLRRDHPLRRGRPRHPAGARPARGRASRWWCGSTARPTRRAARSWPTRARRT